MTIFEKKKLEREMFRKLRDKSSINQMENVEKNVKKYVDSFYGVNDPLYPMINAETKQPLSKIDILAATEFYLAQCSDDRVTNCVWGDGDSLDRERVRDILLEEYNYKFVGE